MSQATMAVNMEMHAHAQQYPPVPVPNIPADAAASPPPIPGLRARRRSSLPSVGVEIKPKKRSANNVRNQAASPEVISSLIDSLSAIQLSTHNHFENLPLANGISASSPASPNLQTQFGDNLLTPYTPYAASTPDHTPYHNSSRQDGFPFPDDDACEPPVIKTSKPPSGLSPLTAPKKKEKEHSLRSYIGRSVGSSASLHSCHSGHSVSSIGNISIETGIPRKVSNGSTRTSSESKRSGRGHRSLMYMSSREHLRQKEAERKRATIQGPEVAASPEVARKPAPQLFVTEDTIKEEPVVAESSRAAQNRTQRGTSPLRNGVNLLNGSGHDGGSPTEKGLIPERGSSLRHSGSPSRRGRKHSRKGSRHDSYKTNTVPEEDENVEPELQTKDKILQELEEAEDEVAQRIRELRKKKLLRDKIAGKLPVEVDAGASASVAYVSPSADAEPSPTSTVSTVSEKRERHPAKAHKVLGIAMQPAPPERRASRGPESKEVRETARINGHARARSLTVNDGDDITPLPINYKLAIQTLERAHSPPPPSSSAASSKGTTSSKSSKSPVRSKSLAVGGRSAVGRKTTNSMIMGVGTTTTAAHKHSTSVTSGALSDTSLRAASEEYTSRHQSLTMDRISSQSSSLQHRPTVKKKRWSHPDLPQKAEQRHNEKVDKAERAAASAAVQPLPHPVIEERPSSLDSIDADVEAYLNSPRLSQRIRHPQTGRIISFSEVGDPRGYAVFVCVGMGLTRYVMAFYDQLALTLKLRLITPDRPGIGGSQVDPNGTPLSWPGKFLSILSRALS